MRTTSRTVRWTVSPNRENVTLNIDGIPYTMPPQEADALSEMLDECAMFARTPKP